MHWLLETIWCPHPPNHLFFYFWLETKWDTVTPIKISAKVAGSLGMSKVNVKINAPNWPAMVKYEECKKSKVSDTGYRLNSSAASLWLTSKYSKASSSNRVLDQSTKYASKSNIVRQCSDCQLLYTNFHMCSKQKETDISPWKKAGFFAKYSNVRRREQTPKPGRFSEGLGAMSSRRFFVVLLF